MACLKYSVKVFREIDDYHLIPISARDTGNAGRVRRTENHRVYRKRLDALLPPGQINPSNVLFLGHDE